MNNEDIMQFLRGQRQALNEMGVVKIGLFGSYARGDAREDSDIDIAVEISGAHRADRFFRLLHFLEDGLNKKIDLGIESALKPAVKNRINKEIIYA